MAINFLIHYLSEFVAHPAGRVLEIAQIAERHVGNEPYVEEAKGQGCHNLPPDEAQIQNEQLPLDARRLPAGEPDGLSSGEGVVGENVVVGEAVAVGGDEPRDNEQHTPQRDADGYLNPAPDQLSRHAQAVQQRGHRHLHAPADAVLFQCGPIGPAGVLGAPVRVDDGSPQGRIGRRRTVQRPHTQLRPHVVIHGQTEDSEIKAVKDG